MAKWIKQGDAYFADTFDRTDIECSCVANRVDTENATFTAYNCCVDNALMNTLAVEKGSHAEGTTIRLDTSGISIGSVDNLSNKLRELQEQIDALKKRPTVTSELRSALKTLHYKREVE